MLSMRLCLHTCTGDSIPGVSWLTGARVASWSVAAVGFSATTSVVRGTLVDICIITDITREFDDTGRQNTTTRSLFHSRPKTYLFHKSFPPQTVFRPHNWLYRLYDSTVSSEHLGLLKFLQYIFAWFRAAEAIRQYFGSRKYHVSCPITSLHSKSYKK